MHLWIPCFVQTGEPCLDESRDDTRGGKGKTNFSTKQGIRSERHTLKSIEQIRFFFSFRYNKRNLQLFSSNKKQSMEFLTHSFLSRVRGSEPSIPQSVFSTPIYTIFLGPNLEVWSYGPSGKCWISRSRAHLTTQLDKGLAGWPYIECSIFIKYLKEII